MRLNALRSVPLHDDAEPALVAPDPAADDAAHPDAHLDATLAELSRRFAASAARFDREGLFPHENFERLHRRGVTGQVVPTAFGGAGAGLRTARRVIGAVAYGEPATALVLTMTYLQHHQLGRADNRWPAALRERVLRDAVRDGALINSLRVEPELGSPARGGLPATVARAQGDHWRIDGHKLYCTGIPALSWLAVWARTDEAEPRAGVFLVPARSPGIRIVQSWDHLGLRASGSHEAIFENVRIPLDHAVDVRPLSAWSNNGTPPDLAAQASQQAWMIVLLGTLYDAVARAARDWLLGFLQSRAPGSLGAPLATLPRVQETVGEIEALLHANRHLLDQAADDVDAGRLPTAGDSGLLKYLVTTNAIRAVELALPLTGNHGLSRQNPLERHYRDVLCSRIHTPQNDSILVAAGKAALATASAPAPAAQSR